MRRTRSAQGQPVAGISTAGFHPAIRGSDKRSEGIGVMAKPVLTLLLASPRGFCAGVDRAIQIVERALQRFGAPVYVRHEIVHNRDVVEGFERKGAVFVE